MTASPLRSKPLSCALLFASVALPAGCASRPAGPPAALASPPVVAQISAVPGVDPAPAMPREEGSGSSGPARVALIAVPSQQAATVPPRVSRIEPVTLPPGGRLTFDQAFGITEARNASLVQQRSALERSRVNYQVVAAGYASDWQARLIGNVQPPLNQSSASNRVGAYYDQTGAELQWTLPWWHKEGVKYDSEAAQIDIASAQSRYEDGVKDQAVNLLKAYIQVRLYEEKVRVSAEQLKVDRARRDFMAQGAQLGSFSDLAVVLQEADLQNQQAATAHLKDELNTKRQALFDLMNVPEADVTLCRNYFEFFSFDPSGWNPDGAIEEQTRSLKLQIAKQDVQQQKSQLTWSPELSLRASYGRQYNQTGSGTQDIANFGAILTLPFPNLSQSAARQELARHDTNDLLTKLDQKVLDTQRTERRDRARIPTLAGNLRFRMQAMAQNRKRLADTRHSFELGLITYLELQTVENSITQSTLQYYDDLADYVGVVVDYARLHGRPLPVPTSCTG
jgi:outer membrane protein TolC